jgi:hypothetical protein
MEDASFEIVDTSVTEDKQRKIAGLINVDEVPEFVKSMLHSSGKPGRVRRLLDKLAETESVSCLRRFLQLHGLYLLKAWLRTYQDNTALCRKVIDVYCTH